MSGLRRWRLALPAAQEEALSGDLWAHGCVGLQTVAGEGSRPEDFAASDLLYIEAYFPDPLPILALDFDLERWRTRGVERLVEEGFEAQDWLATYRLMAEPFQVGERFRIDPGEPTAALHRNSPPPPDAQGRFSLSLPARSAFGTGSHESTRLTMRWLERLLLEGRDVLDVGTGSGILAFACHLLGAGRVVGFDMDLETCCIAQQNMSLNGINFSLFAGKSAALAPCAAFDLLLVNVLPERILHELPALVKRLRPGGSLISSGNITIRREELLPHFTACGLEFQGELEDGEWLAFHFIRAAKGR